MRLVPSSLTVVRKRCLNTSSTRLQSTLSLHSEIIGNRDQQSDSTIFLHGLLGNGRNLKTFANKVCKVQNSRGYLIDMRGHGKSRIETFFPESRHSFEGCVQDIIQATSDLDVESVVGHSWGGRMALQYAATVDNPSLRRVWLLDTVPGKTNDSVDRVIHAVHQILQNEGAGGFERDQLIKRLQELGVETSIAQWLALSYNKKNDFGFDLSVVLDILPDFKDQPFYELLKTILKKENVRVDLVRGGKNKEWDMDILKELQSIEFANTGKFAVHVLPKAGHWVHVDDLHGLLNLFETHRLF